MSNIVLQTKKIGDISGEFILPAYQRGYRWTDTEIKFLLDDVFSNGSKGYCLQPVALKRLSEYNDPDRFELIDGQQRLTTIYLIQKYLNDTSGGFLPAPNYTLSYETRPRSAAFLKNINSAEAQSNIDFFFISNAYNFITEYFKNKKASDKTKLNEYFEQTISVIWYEVPASESGVKLFERLNIGKIPLTSSELVKALFLRSDSENLIQNQQEEIALQWDEMERELSDSSLWSFLTNARPNDYPTRIDLILDLMAGKKPGEMEKYFTFFFFEKQLTDGSAAQMRDIWTQIHTTFLTLREWHTDHELYHKIGYLITSGTATLSDIYSLWLSGPNGKALRKSEFKSKINNTICDSFDGDTNIGALRYDHPNERKEIDKLLLLMNIEAERTTDPGMRRFPFGRHKDPKVKWSLEHIHAQNSEGLNTNEKRREWLEAHIQSLNSLHKNDARELATKLKNLADEIKANPERKNVKEDFEPLRQSTVNLLSVKVNNGADPEEYIHQLPNLALLDCGLNTAISNYVFDAKRNIIIQKDREGKYIPICTKNVFMKYYSGGDTQLHFWGQDDRDAYLKCIITTLKDYLPEQVEETKEEDNESIDE